jgi:XTP/dITP diphosphohydrolase
MVDLVLCTLNAGKLAELRALMPGSVRLRHLGEWGIAGELTEQGGTLEENAVQKAQYGYRLTGVPCLADDSGLEVMALNGEPGVHSAHYAGRGKNVEANIDLVLQKMSGEEDRRARFRTVLAFVDDRACRKFEGVVNGRITTRRRGSDGFGYDPIFIPEGGSLTFAEMGAEEKNRISHRAEALMRFMEELGSL